MISVEGRPLRVLMVGEGWPPFSAGGLNRYVASLHAALPEVGVDSRAVVVGPADPTPWRVSVVPPGGMMRRVVGFARRIHAGAVRADVIDVHFAMYGVVPVLLRLLAGRPLVVHFHGPWADESIDVDARSRSVAAKRAIETAVYRRADRVIVLSEHSRRLLLRYGVDETRIRKVRAGVDPSRFTVLSAEEREAARVAFGVPDGRRLVVAVRRLVPRMGLDLLVESWQAVRRAGIDAELVIIGDGPERNALEAAAKRHGVASSVRFPGKVSEEDLSRWYAAADLAVTPSVQLEGFGLVLLEALMSGTPVLASDVGGIREAIGELGENHLVAPVTVGAWSEALVGALTGERVIVGRAEARAWAEGYSWVSSAWQVRAVYEETITPHP